MPKYISVTQSRTARYDSALSPKDIIGLYSDGFSICNIVIFKKVLADRALLSLTHADKFTPKDVIQKELEWIGHDCEKILVRRNTSEAEHITNRYITPEQLLGFSVIEIAQAKGVNGISIDIESIKEWPHLALPELACHPKEWLLHHTYSLNLIFDESVQRKRQHQPLIFDINHWVEPAASELELLSNTKEFYSQFAKQLTAPSYYEGINVTMNLVFKVFQNPMLCMIFASSAILLYAENNYRDLLKHDIEYFYGITQQIPNTPLRLKTLLSVLNHQAQTDIMSTIDTIINYDKNPKIPESEKLSKNQTLKTLIPLAKLAYNAHRHSQTYVPHVNDHRFFNVAAATAASIEEKNPQP